jgi:IS1 family transposase
LLEISLDVETREIVGVYVGARGRDGAQGLWHALPAVYRQCAVAYTDFWSAYEEIFLSKRHQSVGKDSGKASYIERFNCPVRQRVSRLVKKTLSFSKEVREPSWGNLDLVHPYNASLPI